MCGRYVMDMGHAEIAEIYRDLSDMPPLLKLDVYPSQQAPIFTAESPSPQFVKWGFDGLYGKQLLINARAETVTEKPFFANDFAHSRCAIPCSGFYEWNDKIKHLFVRRDGKALYLAGFCKMQDTKRFIILTKPATSPVEQFHDRIPVLLDKTDIDEYLHDLRFAQSSIIAESAIDLIETQ